MFVVHRETIENVLTAFMNNSLSKENSRNFYNTIKNMSNDLEKKLLPKLIKNQKYSLILQSKQKKIEKLYNLRNKKETVHKTKPLIIFSKVIVHSK